MSDGDCIEDKFHTADSDAHIIMVPNLITYFPGEKTYNVLDETEDYYIIDSGIEGRVSAVEKKNCKAKTITMSGDIR